MIIEPLAGALGAEVRGVSLPGPDEDAWREIRRAFLAYTVLVFRDQAPVPADLMLVGARFGEPCFYPFVTGMDGYPYIFEVVKAENEETNFGGNWHSDTTYLEQPPLATLLYAVETPSRGEIGRASCRERVEMSVGAVAVVKRRRLRGGRALGDARC